MVINLASYGFFGGGSIGNLFASLQHSGFFDYVLPFLLIFAIVYAVLTKSNLFGDKNSINAIISLAVGLMALQFQLVPRFFAEIFPQLGVGLAIILVAVILLSVFSKETGDNKLQNTINYIIFAIAAIVFLVIVFNSLDLFTFGSFGGGFLYNIPWGTIIPIAAVVIGVWLIVKSGGDGNKKGGGKN